MSEFKIIESQEQFDAIVADRISQAKRAEAKKYEGFISPEELNQKLEALQKENKALTDAAAKAAEEISAKNKEIEMGAKYKSDLEKTRIALAAGLDIKYASRLVGETEEEWKADAEALAKDFSAAHYSAPLGSNEPTPTKDKKSAAWGNMINELFPE